jgi:tRNA U55 pseudouridine synthase TruB
MAKRRPPQVHGLVLIDKPAGVTSHDVVNTLRKSLSERRIGHAGTLDPDATGNAQFVEDNKHACGWMHRIVGALTT